mgnify:FL=1|tara:strand:- start:155 stop:436 length:282 start_codon:yes stop_codon:yes gene_type:complete
MKFILILITLFSFIFSEECVCKQHTNIWFRLSSNYNEIGRVYELDMSKGFTFSDEYHVHIIVLDRKTNEQVIISFPYGYWNSDNFTKISKRIK